MEPPPAEEAHPLFTTAWERAGQLRARCPWCCATSSFSPQARGQRTDCPSCSGPLQFNDFLMARVPAWDAEASARGSTAGRSKVSKDQRSLLAALARSLEHHAGVSRIFPDVVLQQLGNELRFEPEEVGCWARQLGGAFELLHPAGWAVVDPSLRAILPHVGGVSSVSFSPDGRLLLSGGDDRTVRLWESATGEPYGLLEFPSAVYSLAVVRVDDGRRGDFLLAVGAASGEVSSFRAHADRFAPLAVGSP
jgi:WD40 repeat protein